MLILDSQFNILLNFYMNFRFQIKNSIFDQVIRF